jgi:hypothetical protein
MASKQLKEYVHTNPNVSPYDLYSKFPGECPNVATAKQTLTEVRTELVTTAIEVMEQPEITAATVAGGSEPGKLDESEAQGQIPQDDDEVIVSKLMVLFNKGLTDDEAKPELLKEYDLSATDLKELVKLGREKYSDQIYEEQQRTDELCSSAMDAEDRAKQAQSQLNKTSLELTLLKKNKRLPTDIDETQIALLAQEIRDDLSWLDLSHVTPRPVFPTWVMESTSLYDGLAKPVSDSNSKYPELIWMPAVQLMLNYLHKKVSIDGMRTNMNLFLGIISEPGKFFKSSSCELAHEYFRQMGLLLNSGPGLRNSDGKVIIGQAGSSEGFGLSMFRINAKHGVLFNDELGKLVAKVGIENSSLPHDLLSWYEGREYSNGIKNTKQSFSFEAGSYCFGWQFCTTTRGFNSQWPRIAGIASGMPDRTFFLLAPKEPKALTNEVDVPTVEGAVETFKLIQKAYGPTDHTASVGNGGIFRMSADVSEYAREQGKKLGDPRSMNLIYTFGLYFAVDLGLDEITEDCITRALALVDYRQKATVFLEPIEAKNDEGRLLKEIIREIRQHGGKITHRDLIRDLRAQDYGDRFWKMVYDNAIRANWIREFTEPGKRGQTKKMVGLVKESVRSGPSDD